MTPSLHNSLTQRKAGFPASVPLFVSPAHPDNFVEKDGGLTLPPIATLITAPTVGMEEPGTRVPQS